jgi:hypothetical protein
MSFSALPMKLFTVVLVEAISSIQRATMIASNKMQIEPQAVY